MSHNVSVFASYAEGVVHFTELPVEIPNIRVNGPHFELLRIFSLNVLYCKYFILDHLYIIMMLERMPCGYSAVEANTQISCVYGLKTPTDTKTPLI
ncbi:hypothetical protein OROMI_022548 [Orobanche minor]